MPLFILAAWRFVMGNKIVQYIILALLAYGGFEAFKAYQQHKGAQKWIDKKNKEFDQQVIKGTEAQKDANSGSDRDKRLDKEFDRDA